MKTLYLKGKTVVVKEESDQHIDSSYLDEHNPQLPQGVCEDCKRAIFDDDNDHCGHCHCCK